MLPELRVMDWRQMDEQILALKDSLWRVQNVLPVHSSSAQQPGAPDVTACPIALSMTPLEDRCLSQMVVAVRTCLHSPPAIISFAPGFHVY